MRGWMLLFACGLAACEREAAQDAAIPAPAAPDTMLPGTAKPQAAAVVPRPQDQAQLDRMILAGYTPHGEHLHPPGVDQCPLTKGSEAVM